MATYNGKYRVKNSKNSYDTIYLETSAEQVKFSDGASFQEKLDKGLLKGDKGEQGIQGVKGDKGSDGLTTSVTVNGTKYTHSSGNITLPNYPTLSSLGAEPKNANIQAHISSAHAPSNAQKNSDITKAEIEAKLTGTVSTHTHPPTSISKTATYNVANGVSGVNRTLFNTARACRTAFLPTNGIVVEKSTDGGITWVDYGLSDSQKIGLFSMNKGHTVKVGGEGLAECTTNCSTRITITPVDRYAQVDMFYCWFSVAGHTCVVDIERSTKGNPTTFQKIRQNVSLGGWAGANEISFPVGQFGGYDNQNSNYYSYRFTFKITTINSSYKTSFPTVTDLRMYGDNCWTTSNSMMTLDSIYDWDIYQNVIFPANITLRGTPTDPTHVVTKSYVDSVTTKYAPVSHTHKVPTPGNYFVNGYAGMTSDGVMEVGKYQDWHNENTETKDFSVRVMCNSSNGNIVTLPSATGTLALTSEIPKISVLTQAEYDALSTKVSNTLYLIKE